MGTEPHPPADAATVVEDELPDDDEDAAAADEELDELVLLVLPHAASASTAAIAHSQMIGWRWRLRAANDVHVLSSRRHRRPR